MRERRGITWRALLLAGASCIISAQAFAADAPPSDIGQIVVSARQFAESIESTAHTILVVTGEQLNNRVDRNVAEGLRELPGVYVQTLGTPGESTNIRIRGGNNGDTLVLLDGVRLNNPITNETNLSLIPVEQIDRIEVLEGSQAVLYGGSAVGGVVNIITKKGGEKQEVKLATEFGDLGYTREYLHYQGSKGETQFNLGFSRIDETGQFANDYFGESALTQRWDIHPTQDMTITIASHIFITQKNLARDFLVGPAPLYDPALPMDAAFIQIALDQDRQFDRFLTANSLKFSYDYGRHYRTELLYGYFLGDDKESNSSLGNANFITPSGIALAPESVLNKMRGQRNSVDLRQFFLIPDMSRVSQQVLVGFEFYDERYSQSGEPFPGDAPPDPTTLGPFIPPIDAIPAPGIPDSRQNYAPYMLYHLEYAERFYMDAGFRWDQNSAYGGELSPRVALAVRIPEIDGKFHAVYGEGFLPPTPNQLFNPLFGNPNLRPQTSQSYEAGYSQNIGKKANLFATFFYLDFDNLIDRLGQNTQDAFSTGLETGFWFRPIPQLTVGANYTFTHSKDESGGGERLADIPTHMFNATLSANPWRSLQIDSTFSYVSDSRQPFPLVSPDLVFVAGTPAASLAGGLNQSYSLWDIAVSYTFDLMQPHPRAIKLYGKAANLLNQQFEATFGFPNPGFHFITGAELQF